MSQPISAAAEPGSGGLRIRTAADLLANPPVAPPVLLGPWLRKGEAVMLSAPTGLGKSMLALSIALAVAGGASLLGWNAPARARVLAIDGEMAEYALSERLGGLARGMGVDPVAVADGLGLLARQGQAVDTVMPDLDDQGGQDTVLGLAVEGRYDLVILDNLTTLATIENENDAASFHGINRFIMRLKQAGIGVLVVHHTGKGVGARYRGSSAIATTFDMTLAMTAWSGPAVDGLAAELAVDKCRHGPVASFAPMAIRVVDDGMGGMRWHAQGADDPKLAAAVEGLRSGIYGTQRALADALGISAGELSKRLGSAVDKGLLTDGERQRAFPRRGYPAATEF